MKSYLQYGFITTGDSDAPFLLCLICNRKLANEAMKPSKLLRHMLTNLRGLKDKPLEFLKRKNTRARRRKAIITTTTSTNVNVLKHHI